MAERGFSLIELILVIVVIGILSAYAVVRSGGSPGLATLPSQAQAMASDIRHAQSLATALGLRVQVSFASGGYQVQCLDDARNPVACRAQLTVSLQNGVTLQNPTPKDLEFDTLGRPYDASGTTPTLLAASATYALGLDGSQKTVVVAPVTGFVPNP